MRAKTLKSLVVAGSLAVISLGVVGVVSGSRSSGASRPAFVPAVALSPGMTIPMCKVTFPDGTTRGVTGQRCADVSPPNGIRIDRTVIGACDVPVGPDAAAGPLCFTPAPFAGNWGPDSYILHEARGFGPVDRATFAAMPGAAVAA